MEYHIKYENMEGRAAPRRRVKSEDLDDQPVFLRKAFNMVSSCPPAIGGWSESGDAMIIKDVKAFSEKVIPTVYRHNNFSSFVRQLNFYGFRKVKADTLEKANWWIFKHPCFLKGQPHLLSEIKRAIHYAENSGCKDVVELRNQVTTLTERIAQLNEQVDMLTNAVSHMQVDNQHEAIVDKKKRKKTTTEFTIIPPVKAEPGTESAFDFDYFMELDQKGEEDEECDALDLLLDEDMEEEECKPFTPMKSTMSTPAAAISTPNAAAPVAATSNPATAAALELSHILHTLTPELKERFVDKLAEVMGAQLASGLTVTPQATPIATATAAPAPVLPVVEATAYADEMAWKTRDEARTVYPSHPTLMLPNGTQAPEVAYPLASAAISAMLISTVASLRNNIPFHRSEAVASTA